MGILEDISQLLQKGKSKKVKELVQQAIDAVSYTHLDVYKRQVPDC